jgi:hypothetical protein
MVAVLAWSGGVGANSYDGALSIAFYSVKKKSVCYLIAVLSCLKKNYRYEKIKSRVVNPDPYVLDLQDPDPYPSFFVRIRIFPSSSKNGKKNLLHKEKNV